MSTRVAEVALTLVTAAFASYFLFDTWGHPLESRIISSFLAVVILVLAAAFLDGHVTGRSEASQPAGADP